jgi:hypothetical protein
LFGVTGDRLPSLRVAGGSVMFVSQPRVPVVSTVMVKPPTSRGEEDL